MNTSISTLLRRSFILAFFLLTISFASGQELQKKVEHLEKEISQANSMKEKLHWMDSLTRVYFYSNPIPEEIQSHADKTIRFAAEHNLTGNVLPTYQNLIDYYNNTLGDLEKSREYFNKIEKDLPHFTDRKMVANLYVAGGDMYYYLKQLEKSNQMYDSAIVIGEKAGNPLGKANALLYKAGNFSDMGKFAEASLFLQDAIKTYESMQLKSGIMKAKNSLAVLYSQNDFFEEAEAERNQVIKLAEAVNNYDILYAAYGNTAVDAQKQGNLQKQQLYFNKALDALNNAGLPDFYKISLLANLVNTEIKLNNLPEAQKLFATLTALNEKEGNKHRVDVIMAEKELALALGNYPSAIALGKEYLAFRKEAKQVDGIRIALKFLADAYQRDGNSAKSLEHLNAYLALNDSISNRKNIQALTYYQTLYETQKRDNQIKSQQDNISLLETKNELKQKQLIFGLLSLGGIFGLFVMYRSRKFAIEKKKQQEQFSKNLIKITEEERKRISSELHDSIGQSLLLIKNRILLNPSDISNDISVVNNAIDEVRNISTALHPFQFEKLGLLKSIEYMVDQLQSHSKIFYNFESNTDFIEMPDYQKIYIYRIIQECLNNVEKHSQAEACQVQVTEHAQHFEFVVKDNGIGFDLTESADILNSLGMKTLKERTEIIGGKLLIDSEKNKGTIISLYFNKTKP
ncbi:MAG: histidine kinase [Flavobacteriaceae bacterium]|nr:histidine kinase [Flavobacteriaceae bacterium]